MKKIRAKEEKIVVELDDVTKTYTLGEVKVRALRGINLKVKQGEFLIVMGVSGSGKSTTMNMIGCLDIPTSGRVLLDGIDIKKLNESRLAQIRGKKIGFVFQQFNLIPSMTALENVELPMVFQGVSKKERVERASRLLSMMGLKNRLNHKPAELSGGERQRVAIARALSNDPQIILADEPTGNLDSKSGREIMGILTDLHKKGKTLVMVTHDPNLQKYADRIVHIKDGVILRESKNENKR